MELSKDEKYVRECLSKEYPQLVINCQKVCGAAYNKYGGDLLAICVEYYLNKPIEYQLKVINDGKLEHFITHLMNFQLKRATTKFYHQYRKFHEGQRELFDNYDYSPPGDLDEERPFKDEKSEVMICIEESIKKLNPYEGMLVKEKILNNLNFAEISEKYNIGYFHLKKDLSKIIKKIKNTCSHLR